MDLKWFTATEKRQPLMSFAAQPRMSESLSSILEDPVLAYFVHVWPIGFTKSSNCLTIVHYACTVDTLRDSQMKAKD